MCSISTATAAPSASTFGIITVPTLTPRTQKRSVGSWQLVFIAMGATGAAIALWTSVRLPETLGLQDRRALDFRSVMGGLRS